MKFAIILVALCAGLLVGGCESQSLLSDEDYYKTHNAAPYSPDPMSHVPNTQQNPYLPSSRY